MTISKLSLFSLFMFFLFVDNVAALEPAKLLEKVYEAQEKLKDAQIAFETQEIKKRVPSKKYKKRYFEKKEERVIGKQIALAVWNPETDEINVIHLRVHYPVRCADFSFDVLDSGYDVERVSGCGPSKLVFSVKLSGKHLVVLAGKHWWIPPELAKEQNYKKLSESAKEAIYTPFSEDFYYHEFVLEGFKILSASIKAAYGDMREKEVVSRALPENLLADAIPQEFLVNIGINEQMDHAKFSASPARTADEVLIEYALNPNGPFRWAASMASARGPYQFTNKAKRGGLGTYDTVAAAYEEMELLDDFEEGTQDLDNMIKAAAALLDMELAKFPLDVHELFKTDFRLAAIYPAACYNGGYGIGLRLYRWIKKAGYKISIENFNPPLAAFTYVKYARTKHGKKTARKIVSAETQTYLKKQMFLWSYIEALEKELKERRN